MTLRIERYVLVALVAMPVSSLSHGDKPHESTGVQQQAASRQQTPASASANVASSTEPVDSPGLSRPATKPGAAPEPTRLSVHDVVADLTLSDFPTLHPMVVHVPVTFIPVALLFSIIGLFSARRRYFLLTLGFAGAGLLGGLVAAFPLHPHTTGLSAAARLTLHKHDVFAYTTLWLALASVMLASISIWKPVTVIRIGVCVSLMLSTISVAITGHHGGTLAYVHGIGVQGRFLSTH
jgi:uncharacterized membrane protein